MANEETKTSKDVELLNRLAFQLFSERSSRMVVKRNAEALAISSYRDAETFLAVSKKLASGELTASKPTGPQLSNCCAPNLKPNHPLNMVAARFNPDIEAALKRIRAIHDKLEANPGLEELPEYDWGKPEVNTARAVFPAYVGAAAGVN